MCMTFFVWTLYSPFFINILSNHNFMSNILILTVGMAMQRDPIQQQPLPILLVNIPLHEISFSLIAFHYCKMVRSLTKRHNPLMVEYTRYKLVDMYPKV